MTFEAIFLGQDGTPAQSAGKANAVTREADQRPRALVRLKPDTTELADLRRSLASHQSAVGRRLAVRLVP